MANEQVEKLYRELATEFAMDEALTQPVEGVIGTKGEVLLEDPIGIQEAMQVAYIRERMKTNSMFDIPSAGIVELVVDVERKLWLNVDGVCVARIGQIEAIITQIGMPLSWKRLAEMIDEHGAIANYLEEEGGQWIPAFDNFDLSDYVGMHALQFSNGRIWDRVSGIRKI